VESRQILAIVAMFVFIAAGGLLAGLGNILFNPRSEPPRPVITSKDLRTGWVNGGFRIWVDVTVHNIGGPGTVTVAARVALGNADWDQQRTIYLQHNEEKSLTFTFTEFWGWDSERGIWDVWIVQ